MLRIALEPAILNIQLCAHILFYAEKIFVLGLMLFQRCGKSCVEPNVAFTMRSNQDAHCSAATRQFFISIEIS